MENWTPAPERPGYRRKTLKRGNATIIIYRPIQTDTEAHAAQQKARTALESAMRDYYGRKARAAAV